MFQIIIMSFLYLFFFRKKNHRQHWSTTTWIFVRPLVSYIGCWDIHPNVQLLCVFELSSVNPNPNPKSTFSPHRGDSLHRFKWNLAWPKGMWAVLG